MLGIGTQASFFLAYSQQSDIGCLPYFHTWCGLGANLECMSEMRCTRLAEIQDAKITQKYRHLRTITQLCRAISSQLRHESTIGKKLVKQQYLLHRSSQYELWPTNGWDLLGSLGHPNKFKWVSRLGFVTAPTSLNGGQPNFSQCLAISWAGTLYIHFWSSCPLMQFCQLQNSLRLQVLCSPILIALLHGTWAVSISQSLRHGTRNRITELSQRVPPIFGRAAITLGIGPHSSCEYITCMKSSIM